MMALAGQKTITAAATPEILGNQVLAEDSVLAIKALSTNTGTISVSDTSAGTAAAWVLAATDPAIYLEVPNLNSVWLAASVNGEGVMWYVTKP
jgi:hypothetical protein